MNKHLLLLAISVAVIAVACAIILIAVHPHRASGPEYLLNILNKYYDSSNITLHIGNGETKIRTIIELNRRTVENLQTILLNNVTIGHVSSRTAQLYFIRGAHMLVTYQSSMISQTTVEYRNFLYIFYINYRTGRSYECFRGTIKIFEGYRTYTLNVGGTCLLYNFTSTPFELSKIYYECVSDILRKMDCRKETNIVCSFNGSINYIDILYREIKIFNRVEKHGLNITYIRKLLGNTGGTCYVDVRAILSGSDISSMEDVLCSLKNVKFSIASSSRYVNVGFIGGRYGELIRQVSSFRKIELSTNLRNSTFLMRLLYGIECVRNVPEPFALVQVLNMPVELILVSVMLHVY
ncbi:MAG: hypothetical protein GXO23_02610 [Crenarchaeota archaeon]|nr:hypothetical protein [Thermoproteota archaeon]